MNLTLSSPWPGLPIKSFELDNFKFSTGMNIPDCDLTFQFRLIIPKEVTLKQFGPWIESKGLVFNKNSPIILNTTPWQVFCLASEAKQIIQDEYFCPIEHKLYLEEKINI